MVEEYVYCSFGASRSWIFSEIQMLEAPKLREVTSLKKGQLDFLSCRAFPLKLLFNLQGIFQLKPPFTDDSPTKPLHLQNSFALKPPFTMDFPIKMSTFTMDFPAKTFIYENDFSTKNSCWGDISLEKFITFPGIAFGIFTRLFPTYGSFPFFYWKSWFLKSLEIDWFRCNSKLM